LSSPPPPAPALPLPQAVKIVTAHRRRYAAADETFLQLLAERKGNE